MMLIPIASSRVGENFGDVFLKDLFSLLILGILSAREIEQSTDNREICVCAKNAKTDVKSVFLRYKSWILGRNLCTLWSSDRDRARGRRKSQNKLTF